MSVSAHLKRRIGSWYVGVPVDQVAAAERCTEAQVRAARIELRKEPELGLNPHANPEPRAERQMTFAEIERLMRSNRSSAL